ncbi:hypothetical protein GGF43_002496 [Coemansia sp. RSA 2618]|nr:hypothetical protein GGF43_002496 [Coemansia sp. RSA 2618]
MLLSRHRLDLFVFTRAKVYKACIGFVGFVDQTLFDVTAIDDISDTLKDLWFLMTLPVADFGYLVPFVKSPCGFNITSHSGLEVGIEALYCDYSRGDASVLFNKRIPKSAHIFGQLAYLYRTKFRGRDAVAKISWSPVDRLPECAVYELLEEAAIPGIPNVAIQGFIRDNAFGYRVELILLEDCGVPIDQHFASRNRIGRAEVERQIGEFISQVAETLVFAFAAGILHRDLSLGNIIVKDGKAYLIDWGCSKLLPTANTADVVQKWKLDREQVIANKDKHDRLIGTPLFMAIQVLLGGTNRSLIHDMESLFIVGLYVLALDNKAIGKSGDMNHGWAYLDYEMTATLRVGCLINADMYLDKFGCGDCAAPLMSILDAFYRVLFLDDTGNFLGGDLLRDANFERRIDLVHASEFLSESTCAKLKDMLDLEYVVMAHPAETTPIQASSVIPHLAASSPKAFVQHEQPGASAKPAGHFMRPTKSSAGKAVSKIVSKVVGKAKGKGKEVAKPAPLDEGGASKPTGKHQGK